MSPTDLFLFFLATWYIAFALTRTNGPFELFLKFRTRWPNVKLYRCIVCMAPYAAVFVAILYLSRIPLIMEVLASSGATVFLFRFTGGSHTEP